MAYNDNNKNINICNNQRPFQIINICDGYFKDLSQAFDYALEDIITLKDFKIKVSNNCKYKERKKNNLRSY